MQLKQHIILRLHSLYFLVDLLLLSFVYSCFSCSRKTHAFPLDVQIIINGVIIIKSELWNSFDGDKVFILILKQNKKSVFLFCHCWYDTVDW